MVTQTLDELTQNERKAFQQMETKLLEDEGDIRDGRDQAFTNLERKLMGRIENLEQMVKSGMTGKYKETEEYDQVTPFDKNVSMETMPQISGSELSEHNDHISHLSNHELHQMKSMHEKDHRREPHTIMDEPLGEVLDKTINFLVHSYDGYTKKIYEAELMEGVHGNDGGYYKRFKVHLIAMILFIRDDRNIIYIGFLMIFVSIIIYFINIITIRDA